MIQVKEFIDTDTSYAEKQANLFLAGLKDSQVISVRYGSVVKANSSRVESQRSAILVVYKTADKERKKKEPADA
ncbi:hypothetical protein J31TS4_11170 [Paenibacillus sp. J31TS4]|uniref:sporulation protein Cse60 n=1 Tax=Paenibacillus sp. J31TS4 TaxID=2807195 RepID=UPI001B2A45F4|nr:sporulation protein Cse60 [Paenibacillus sp. J31TS4]GIP37837.1 hypothetical protein J31TS4_11170 [Paenibacillus sp. J31TS4]